MIVVNETETVFGVWDVYNKRGMGWGQKKTFENPSQPTTGQIKNGSVLTAEWPVTNLFDDEFIAYFVLI